MFRASGAGGWLPMAHGGAWQAEILAQRGARIVGVVQTPSLQLGHDVLHKVGVRAWYMRRRDDEAVARALDKELLQRVGDFSGSTDNRLVRTPTVRKLHELTGRGIGFA